MKKFFTPGLLQIIALIVLLAGSAGSLGLMLYAGRNNKSVILILLFVLWVLSPFIALLIANVVSKRYPVPARITVYCLILFITPGSLISYSGILSPPGAKPAAVFLIVPLVSWLLIVIVLAIAGSLSREKR